MWCFERYCIYIIQVFFNRKGSSYTIDNLMKFFFTETSTDANLSLFSYNECFQIVRTFANQIFPIVISRIFNNKFHPFKLFIINL